MTTGTAEHSNLRSGDEHISIPAWWREIVQRHGDRELIRYLGKSHSFHDIDRRSAALARGLLAQGAGKGTRIGLLMPNGPDWVVSWLAIERIGAIAVTLSTFFAARELAYALKHADVAILLAADQYLRHDYAARIAEALPDITTRLGEKPLTMASVPFLRGVWLTGKGPAWSRGTLAELEQQGAASTVYSAALLASVEANVSPADLAVLIYTSGSTSDPKGVMHVQGVIVSKTNFMAEGNGIIPSCTEPGDRGIVTGPFFWIGGFLSLAGCMVIGATVICEDEHTPKALLEAIRREKATHVNGSEAALRALADSPDFRPGDMDRLKPQNSNQFGFYNRDPEVTRDRFALSIGMTETFGPHSGLNNRGDLLPKHAVGSLGPILDGMQYRIVDPETRQPVPTGTPGDLCVRGPWLMDGFYKRLGADIFDADGFYPTGDQCHLDENGYLYFHGRLGGMIKTAGANVSPEEVENVIAVMDDVLEVAVFGVNDAKLDQMVVAVVAIAADSTLDEEGLKGRLRGQLSSFKVPKRIFFMDFEELPRTPSKKIRKPALAEIIKPLLAKG